GDFKLNNQKLWTKDCIIISSINFFLTLVFYLLVVIIALYAVDAYGASTSQAGLVTGIFIIGTLIGRIIIGRYIDVIGRKKNIVYWFGSIHHYHKPILRR